MDRPSPLTYALQRGDTLYSLAKRFHTTVQALLAENKRLNTHFLRVGDVIYIPQIDKNSGQDSPATEVQESETNGGAPSPEGVRTDEAEGSQLRQFEESNPQTTISGVQTAPRKAQSGDVKAPVDAHALQQKTRELWTQHTVWVRALTVSVLDSLLDNFAATQRLLRFPSDLSKLYSPYYGTAAADQIEKLFTSHITIADQFVRALKRGEEDAVDEYARQWRAIVKDISAYLARLNPNFNRTELEKLLEELLDLIKRGASYRYSKQYAQDTANFDDIVMRAMRLADYMSNGLIVQFTARVNRRY